MKKEETILKGLNDAANKIHQNAKEKGFWDEERETGTLLMLCVSELSEALEADRKDKYCHADEDLKEDLHDPDNTSPNYCIDHFEIFVKDTFEDELADTVIRILDMCGRKQIDLEWHINKKLAYNKTREKMHGKKY